MEIKIALAGNPNCGKTTLFNALTGSNQYVGNWPGVTVEKKEGGLKGEKEVVVQDLPGIYSLSPYTLEEVVARSYLVNEKPDVILNIVDGTNMERNLYLTTQLIELGIPVVVAVNMIDLVRRNGDQVNLNRLGEALGCQVVEMSALKGEGGMEAARRAVEAAEAARSKKPGELPHVFTGSVEHALAHIEESIAGKVEERALRWYAIKIFERDEKVMAELCLDSRLKAHLEEHIKDCEQELDDDAESIITNQRYSYIHSVVEKAVKKKAAKHSLTVSDKIDRIVTNRVLALPIFAAVMILVYYIAISTVGTIATDWANDGVFGDGWHLFGIGAAGYEEAAAQYEAALEEAGASSDLEAPDPAQYGVWVPGIPGLLESGLDAVGCAGWLKSLILDGIVAGVGAVLGFVPQMLILFLMLSLLEDIGYMARVAFIMDRVFRRFGLSGKSFIPMLIASGCGVPGIMASRTIENERDRRMTVMTTCFIPCGAKMPIIALFAGALFGGSWVVAASAYFIGVAAVVVSGIVLKKTKMFAGDPAPFVMELPAYHVPAARNVLHATWERGWSFIKRAGTVILASSIILWFLQGFGFVNGAFGMVEDNNHSLLASLGGAVSFLFAPLGFGTWKPAVATFTGLIAKENVVGTFGVLYGFAEVAENGTEIWGNISSDFTQLSAFSFMIFNLLCAPCFAAMGAIKREMNSAKWTFGAIGYMCGLAYAASFIVYQLGLPFTGAGFSFGTALAALAVVAVVYLLARKNKFEGGRLTVSAVSAAGK